MAIPAEVAPDDEAIRPSSADSDVDGWSVVVKLDPTKDWSNSTFTVDGSAPFTVDDSHKADETPLVTVNLTPAQLFAVARVSVHYNLTEDIILRRTFLTGRFKVVKR